MSTTLYIIVAFRDITISCQIKSAFLLIFSNRNCLINEQALICTDDHTTTQLHQIAHPEMVHHIVLITEWQPLPGVVYINAAWLWKGDNCGAKCCRGWQDPFLDLSRAAVIERVALGSKHTEADELICTNMHAHMWAHVHTHRQTKSATLHIEMIVSCLCQVLCVFFLQPWRPHPGKLSNFWLKTVPVIRALTICNHLALH